MGIVFMNILQQLIPYEIPSVLQTHGKVLHHSMTLANASIYVSTVKKRLLELGVKYIHVKIQVYIRIYV